MSRRLWWSTCLHGREYFLEVCLEYQIVSIGVNLNLKANEGEVSKRAHLTGVVSFGAGCAEEKYPGENFLDSQIKTRSKNLIKTS